MIFTKKIKRGLERINKQFDLPGGLLSGGTHIDLQSNTRAIIDGRCTVFHYSTDEIKINTGTGLVVFSGRNLTIKNLCKDSICICGVIKQVEFV